MEEDLVVSRSCVILGTELRFRATASGGAGGQHVNTANTRVELTFNIAKSRSLGPRQQTRLIEALGPAIRVVASERRSQWQNRQLARQRLAKKLERALATNKHRVATKPSKAAKTKRVDNKRKRAQTKRLRRPPKSDD